MRKGERTVGPSKGMRLKNYDLFERNIRKKWKTRILSAIRSHLNFYPVIRQSVCLLDWDENHYKTYWLLNALPFQAFLCVLQLDFSFLLFSIDSHCCSHFSTAFLVFWHKYVGQLGKIMIFPWQNDDGIKDLENYFPPQPFLSSCLDVSFKILKDRIVNS